MIGGGPAGSICARELARRGHTVVLLERRLVASPRLGETCGPGLRRALEGDCGLIVPPPLFSPLPSFFSAWGAAELDNRSFSFWHAGNGMVLDRRAFDEWLLGEAAAAGVTVLRGCTVTSARRDENGWLLSGVTGADPVLIPAGFIVEATGRMVRSVIQPDIMRFFTDDLVCISVEVPGPASDDPVAAVESCAAGWWYTARLPNNRQVIALFTDADLVAPAGTRLEWLVYLFKTTVHMCRMAPGIPNGARVRVWNARTSVRNVLWRGCWISIGDAAWCLDPLSGTGIERAVKAGVGGAAAISQAMNGGDIEPLRSFTISEAQAFQHSLTVQHRYYESELRWKKEVFWQRRLRA